MRYNFLVALLIRCGFSPESASRTAMAMIEGGQYGAHEFLRTIGTSFPLIEEAEVCN